MENIDVNIHFPTAQHPHHNRHQLLLRYTTALRQLRALAEQKCHVRPLYFDNFVLFQYLQQRSSEDPTDVASGDGYTWSLAFFKLELLNHILDRRRQILYWVFYILLVFLCFFAYRHHNTSTANTEPVYVQSYVYPSMRMWRRITLPLIQRFPQLTELYDMHCLMENPFFQLEDLNCEPCADVENVLDLTHISEHEGYTSEKLTETPSEIVPFVFKINQQPIQLDDLYNIYASNHEIFQRDAYRVQSTNRHITNLEELFSQFNHSSTEREHLDQAHSLWRCNRMLPARLLRQIFASPVRLPRTGIALERYMSIDTAQAPSFTLPDTECANVYVQQALGARFIILRPTSECRHRCRTLSMHLPQSFVLSYNWRYWKPISAPDPLAETLSITLIGSYC